MTPSRTDATSNTPSREGAGTASSARKAVRARRRPAVAWGPGWLYGLVIVPALTDLVELGRWPMTAREGVTEIVAGLVIAALVRRVRQEHLAVLAQALTDALTGLGNRRAFVEHVEDEMARTHRSGQALSLVYIDVDAFKRLNDLEGHERGDRILRQLGEAIAQAGRARLDRGFRLGGDEFALLLPGSTAAQSEAVVARVRELCARADRAWSQGPLGLSVGIVEHAPGESLGDFVSRADAAMYRVKPSRAR